MSASLNRAEGTKPRGPFGLPPLLGTIAAAVLFPFDEVLRGMVGAGLGIENLCLILGITRSFLDEQLVRLGLPTPNDKPVRKPGARAWSPWDRFRTTFWRKMGVHPEIIGQKVGRTAGAVRAQCRRMGIKAPSRKALYKPDPATLRDPEHGFFWPQSSDSKSPANNTASPTPESACGRAVGRITWRGRQEAEFLQPEILEPINQSVASSESFAGPAQGELPILGIIGGTDQGTKKTSFKSSDREIGKLPRPIPEFVIPRTEAEVDFNSDLKWIGKTRRVLTNKVVVWICGMLYMGGLSYSEAAERVGMTAGAFRTFRTRSGIPVDEDRTKFGAVFDEQGARATLAASGYKLRQCITACESRDGKGNWFWVEHHDRFTRLSPPKRKRDHDIEGRFNRITIIKSPVAVPATKQFVLPFAKNGERSSWTKDRSWSAAHA